VGGVHFWGWDVVVYMTRNTNFERGVVMWRDIWIDEVASGMSGDAIEINTHVSGRSGVRDCEILKGGFNAVRRLLNSLRCL